MKKIIPIVIALLAIVFYSTAATYTFESTNIADGFVFSDKKIQENLYAEKDEVLPIHEVKSGDGIYTRFGSTYIGEDDKVKVNFDYPMYVSDGNAITLLSGKETLINLKFETFQGFAYATLNDGLLFDEDYNRADYEVYFFAHLSNGLYINSFKINVKTTLNEYDIPANSIIYFTPESIRYYRYDNGNFAYSAINDVDDATVITMDGIEYTYGELLLNLGETVEYHDIEHDEKGQEKRENALNDAQRRGVEGNVHEASAEKTKTEPGSEASKKIAQKNGSVAKNAKNKAAEKAQELEKAPETPVVDPNEGLVIKYPSWEMPKVTMATDLDNGTGLRSGVYTLKTSVNVTDPAGVISGGVVFEIEINEGGDAGTIYKRTSFTVSSGEAIKGIVAGLRPDYNYKVRAYFKYMDKYGRVQDAVYFLNDTEFKTKPVSDLGPINIEISKDNALYDDHISINSIKFAENSDQDTVGSLSRVNLRTYENSTAFYGVNFSSTILEQLMSGTEVGYEGAKNLKSGHKYSVKIFCYDRYGNELKVTGNTLETKTCKKIQEATIETSYVKDSSGKNILGKIKIKVTVENPDKLKYENLCLEMLSGTGEYYSVNGTRRIPISEGVTYTFDNLVLGTSYSVSVKCKTDIDDDQGYIEREIGNKMFSTSRIEDLGNLFVNATNYTADLTSETKDSYKRAWVAISINKSKTNVQLPSFLTDFQATFTDENQNSHTYTLTQDELDKFTTYGTVWIDTNKFCPTGLLSNTKYTLSFQALNIDEGKATTILCSSNLSLVKTDRKPVDIEMKNVEALSGYITAKINVSDVDDFMVEDSVILNVYKVIGGKTTMVGSFRIPKNQTDPYELGMFQDSSQSSDGLSYSIEGNTTYRFVFVAEEVNLERGNQSNYVIKSTDIRTIAGVTGNLYLEQLLERDALIEDIPSQYTQLQYIQSTGSEYIQLPFGFNNDAEVSAKGMIMDTNTNKFLISTASRQTDRRFAILGGYTNFGIAYGNKATAEGPFSPATTKASYLNKAVTVSYKDKKFTTDDGLSIDVKGFSFAGTTSNIRLFFGYSAATKGKIYSFKYKDSTRNVYLVPVKKNATGAVGFYDIYSGTFYTQTNTGGGLIGGPKVTEYTLDTSDVPEEYSKIEYVEANGTQYIETNYVPTANTKIELETKIINKESKYAITGNNEDANSIIFAYNGSFYRSNGIAVDSVDTENGTSIVSYTPNYVPGSGAGTTGYHWEFKYYNDTIRSSYPTLERVKSTTPDYTRYFYDYEISKAMALGDYYVGYAKTCLYFNEATTITYGISCDDESTVYLNGNKIDTIGSCATKNFKFNFIKGWNTLEIVYREGAGGDGWIVTPQIRTTASVVSRTAGFTGVSLDVNNYSNHLKLFGVCDANYNTSGRIYDYKVYEGTELKMHLVPVRRRADNVIGFYDVINEEFYIEESGTNLIGGAGKVSPNVTYNTETQYLAKVVSVLSDVEEWLTSKTTYVDVYRTVNGTTTKEYEGIQVRYDGTGGKYSFYYPVDIDDNSKDSYTFKLYFVSKTGQQVNLASTTFTTEEQIYTISTIQEFEAVKSSARKYVVVNDIGYTEDRYKDTQYTYTSGPWGTSTFNARIDFQGFALTYYGSGPLLYQMSSKAKISNIVYNEHCVFSRKNNALVNSSILNYGGTSINRFAGALVYLNYGTITNAQVNYYQETPGTYHFATYWQDTMEEDAGRYPYFENSGFVVDNHGVVENFVANMYGDERGNCYYSQYGGLICHNYSDGTIRNGYIYSENIESNYRAQVYMTGKANNNVPYYGIMNSVNESGGLIENVYVLGDIYTDLWTYKNNYTGIVCGYNLGVVRNTYTVGNLTNNSKVYNVSYGPNIGVNSGNGRYVKNNNYISEYTYNNSSNTSTSSLSLRNISWQESVLNEGNSQFNVKELVNVNCYPHVRYSSDVMPLQTYISLPDTTIGSVDVLFTGVYNAGDDPEIDAELSPYITGDELWTTSVGKDQLWPENVPERITEDEFYSGTQVVVVYVSDKTGSLVYGMTSTDGRLVARCIKQVNDGTGISCCYMVVYNPTKALNKYKIKDIVYEDIKGDAGTTISVSSYGRYLNVSFYHLISSETGEGSWQYLRSNKDENYRLTDDLDFKGMDFKDIHVSGAFNGYLDGQGHSISNVQYKQNELKDFYSTFSVTNTNSGLFCTLNNATILNLELENIYVEGGTFSGALAGYLDNGYVENVYAKNVYVASSMYSGGLFGRINSNTEVRNCGVDKAKVVVTGACHNDWICCNAGGFAGWLSTNNTLERVYATNIYVEALDSSVMYTSAGGLIPYIEGSLNEIRGAYVTGTIVSSAMHTGGLIGANATTCTIDNVYSDVDIYTYQGNTAGGIGRAYNTITGKAMLVFGDVIAARIYDVDDTATPASINAIGNGTASYYKGMYYEGMKVNRDNYGTNYASGTSFSSSLIQTGELYTYLSENYFKVDDNAAKGVLPKLIDKNGNELPGQPDTLIGYAEEEGMIRVNLSSIKPTYSNGTKKFNLDMTIDHDSNIVIEKVYTDFTYIDIDLMAADSKYRGINTYSKNITFGNDANSSTTMSKTSVKTIVSIKNQVLNSAYDNYHITAIKYTDKTDKSVHYLRLNYNLDCVGQQFKTISTQEEYESLLGGSIAENFYLATDVDFNNSNKSYCDETVVNVVVNRLVGVKGSSLDYTNSGAYYKIANISYNNGDQFTENYGQIYNDYVGLFRNVLAELRNITFENVDSTRTRGVGVIGGAHGTVDGVQFIDCDIKSTGGDGYCMGLFVTLDANVSNVYAYNCKLDNVSNDNSGVLTGRGFGNYFTGHTTNITIDQCSLRSSASLTSFIFGRYQTWYTVNSTQKNIQNINVSNSSISGSTYTAGIMGYRDGSVVNIIDATMTGNTVKGTSSYTGGIVGDSNGSYQTTNIYIKDNFISGQYRTGGVYGWANYGAYLTVVDSTIISNSDQCGALCGYFSGNYTYPNQTNYTAGQVMAETTSFPNETYYMGFSYKNKVYGNTSVGGIAGYNGNNRSYGLVEDCEIKGNSYVGGVAGYEYYSGTGYAVKDSTITPYDSLADASSHGVSYSATPKYFGGIYGGYGRMENCIVSNCVIGGENADYVGGFQGWGAQYDANQVGCNSICQDCVVIGQNYVGGLFGSCGIETANYASKFINMYSNAYVYGKNFVGGIAGKLTGYYTYYHDDDLGKNVYYHYRLPVLENLYFTGSIISENTAGALFGCIDGNYFTGTQNNMFRYISSLPAYIKAKTVAPVFADCEETAYYYKWEDIDSEIAPLYVSLWADTKIYISGTNTVMTMKDLLNSKSYYSKYIGSYETVKANFTKGVAGDEFIILYDEIDDGSGGTISSSDAIADNFYTWSLNPNRSEVTHTSYNFYGYTDIVFPGYMPEVISGSTTLNKANVLFNNYLNSEYNGVDFRSLAYKPTGERYTVHIEQGVEVPGTDEYYDKLGYLESLYTIYDMSGLEDLNLSGNNELEIPEEYTVLTYLKSTGTQYLVLPYTHNVNTWVDMTVSFNKIYNYNSVYGAASSDNSSDSMTFGIYTGGLNCDFGKGSQKAWPGLAVDTPYRVVWNGLNVVADGTDLKLSAKATTCKYQTAIFTRNIAGGFQNEIGQCAFYALKIYEGIYNSVSESTLKYDLVPVRNNITGELGMYDRISKTFFTNKGTGTFIAGEDTSNIIDESDTFDYSEFLDVYATGVDKLNIEFTNAYMNKFGTTSTMKLYATNGTAQLGDDIINGNVTTSTYTINYDYKSTLCVELNAGGKTYKINYYPSAVRNTLMLYGSDAYALSADTVYGTTGSEVMTNVANIYDGYLMDFSGNIYSVTALGTVNRHFNSNSQYSTVLPLYEFTHMIDGDEKTVRTYATRTTVQGTSTLDLLTSYRLFSKSGKLITVKQNSSTAIQPVYAKYANNESEIVLQLADKVVSIGTSDLLAKFGSAFSRSGIKCISSNLGNNVSATNSKLLVEYTNGKIVCYDTVSHMIKWSKGGPKMTTVSLPKFLMTSMTSMFKVEGDDDYTSSANATSEVVDYLNENDITLGEIVSVTSQDNADDVASDITTGTNFVLTAMPRMTVRKSNTASKSETIANNDDSKLEENIPGEELEGAEEFNINIKGKDTEGTDEENVSEVVPQLALTNLEKISIPNLEEIVEEINENLANGKESAQIVENEGSSETYVSVFNDETEEFEIFDTKELVENEEPVSETSRIVDRSSLKALYSSLGENEDHTTERGIVFYLIIAAVIFALMIPVFALKKKQS